MTSYKSLSHFIRIFLFLILYISALELSAQISYGGQPLPLYAGAEARTLNADKNLFVEMPAFDVQEALLRSESEQMRFKSLEFAHKFYVHLRPDNSGITFTTQNMKVWRVGLRSKNAYSLNILFTKFRLPEGAKVFVYNTDQTEILGSYTHQNNTDLNLLPVQPINSDEIIVEYQEPENAEFTGEIEIGEVNHDFMGIFRATEPRDPEQDCHPNLVCYPEDIEQGSGVLALIINGKTYCTGSLVNNTNEDGTPYLLTATHCINGDYDPVFIKNSKYDVIAGTIVAFFNYKSPSCSTNIRGPVQMSLASADSVLISERHDISLLKFKNVPPKEYQPIYLGWNANTSPTAPFHGIHSPNGGVLKVAVDEDALGIATFSGAKYNMEPNAHWAVKAWEVGATEGGSSGSPLLDKDKRIVGTLTGGESMCSSPRGPDVYASLTKYWKVTGSLGNPNSISTYLDPQNSQFQQLDSFNPYENEPIKRSQNFDINEVATQTFYNSVPVFATNNTFGYTEFAEEFNVAGTTKLDGVFISSPLTSNILNMNLKIRVYSGKNSPETLVHEQPFNFSYQYYQNGKFSTTLRDMRRNVENYIRFTNPISVTGKFFISYYDANGVSSGFSAMNVEPRKVGSGIPSTAWMKNATGWVKSSENLENPINTSLLIAPYVIGTPPVIITPADEDFTLHVYHSKEVERIFIESNKELLSWEIFYVSGQKIHQEKTNKSINRVSFSSGILARGVYIVKVTTAEGSHATKKVLVM